MSYFSLIPFLVLAALVAASVYENDLAKAGLGVSEADMLRLLKKKSQAAVRNECVPLLQESSSGKA